ncbi:MAG: sugar ABC transporter permease [Chloroflexi bacterium]|nr:sugar ABC transporter permease [Chloroflexota bacterium]
MSQAVTLKPQATRPRAWRLNLSAYRSTMRRHEALWGLALASPWLLGLLIFVLGPIIASFYLSFTRYDVISRPEWLGMENYVRAFTGDDLFWPSLGRTFRYALAVVPLGIAGSLGLAMLLNRGLKATNVYRTLYFLPHLTPIVAMALLWRWLLHPSVGPVNYLLGHIGIEGPGWLSNPQWALTSIVIISLWAYLGGDTMLIFLAGLQGVPQELYDAAEVDGAGGWHKFLNVTLPMISPTIFFNLIIGVIGALKVFALAYVATQGGPAWATWFYALHVYRWSFEYFEMGYGAALSWIFAGILIIFTALQFSFAQRWVFYEGGEE